MTAKEYLSQAYRLDQRINSKLDQVSSLRALAHKVTKSYASEGGHGIRQMFSMENTIVKIIDLEHEIDNQIDKLIDLKQEIVGVIQAVDNLECQFLLELRYLTFKTWKEIADNMGFTFQWVHTLHQKALRKINLKHLIKIDSN